MVQNTMSVDRVKRAAQNGEDADCVILIPNLPLIHKEKRRPVQGGVHGGGMLADA